MTRFIGLIPLVLIFTSIAVSQPPKRPLPTVNDGTNTIKSSAAYAEVLFRKTELEAEIESLLMEFTEDYPKVRDVRIELDVLKSESARLLTVKPGDSAKLTLALGKLILGKVSHAAALKRLQTQYQDGHPSVKKEKRMVEIFEAAIKEILE